MTPYPGGQVVDAVQPRDVEDDAAADERREGVDAVLGEALVRLDAVGVEPAEDLAVLADMGQRVDVGADMAAGDDDLVGRRAPVRADVVAVAALQGHLERRVVRRLRHAAPHRLGEVDDARPRHRGPQGGPLGLG